MLSIAIPARSLTSIFGTGNNLIMARRGRPLKEPEPGERVPLSLRISPSAKKKLEAAAELNGRSLSQEAEYRIERSFDREDISKSVGAELRRELRALMSEGSQPRWPTGGRGYGPNPTGGKPFLKRVKPGTGAALEPKPKGRGKDAAR